MGGLWNDDVFVLMGDAHPHVDALIIPQAEKKKAEEEAAKEAIQDARAAELPCRGDAGDDDGFKRKLRVFSGLMTQYPSARKLVIAAKCTQNLKGYSRGLLVQWLRGIFWVTGLC